MWYISQTFDWNMSTTTNYQYKNIRKLQSSIRLNIY